MHHGLKKDVVLVVPNVIWVKKRDFKILPPVIPILTALLKDEFNFSVIDANIDDLTQEAFAKRLKQMLPSIVLLSSPALEMHQLFKNTISIIKAANPSCVTIIGGPHPTSLPE